MAQKSNDNEKNVSAKEIAALTEMASPFMRCQLAGYLIREEEDAVFVADPQGTWVIPRTSIESLNDWPGGKDAPQQLLSRGRPVQIALKDGSTIHEIRPWRIQRGGNAGEMQARREAIRSIFSLEAGDLPTTERTGIGEREITRLEMLFARRLGWDPNKSPNTQQFFHGFRPAGSWCGQSDGGVT